MEKLIITVAPTGSLPTKEQNPHVPITAQEIADCALRCEDAGASIFHIHARDENQKPSDDPERFAQVEKKLRGRTNLILQISTGARAGKDLESRRARLTVPCEMASLTTGSVNFPRSAYVNAPDLVDGLAEEMQKRKIKPEIEVFDTAMIGQALDMNKRGLIPSPLHFDFVMGLKNSQPATIRQLEYLVSMIPSGSTWTVAGVGRAQLVMGCHAILMGGHVRVGLEDNIYYRKGELATNEMLVERIARIAKEMEREVATPDEARGILGLK